MLNKIETIKEKAQEAIDKLCTLKNGHDLFSQETKETISSDKGNEKYMWLNFLNIREELKGCIEQLGEELKALKKIDISLCERLHENMTVA